MSLTIKLDFRVSNNEAEYEALLLGLGSAQIIGATQAISYSFSARN